MGLTCRHHRHALLNPICRSFAPPPLLSPQPLSLLPPNLLLLSPPILLSSSPPPFSPSLLPLHAVGAVVAASPTAVVLLLGDNSGGGGKQRQMRGRGGVVAVAVAGLAHGWCFLAPIPFLSNACNSCGGTPTHGPTALGQLHMRCISLANAWPTNECVGCRPLHGAANWLRHVGPICPLHHGGLWVGWRST